MSESKKETQTTESVASKAEGLDEFEKKTEPQNNIFADKDAAADDGKSDQDENEDKSEIFLNKDDDTFTPIVKLEKQETRTHEEEEEEVLKMRAKLFRFDKTSKEWKERGIGDMRILKHKETNKARLVMRRERTHKLCSNHYITITMKLTPNIGSDRSWIWSTACDVSEGVPSEELLAIRFSKVEGLLLTQGLPNIKDANTFKEKFEEAQKGLSESKKDG